MPITHEGFLKSICETPDDDAPRLIYADWLEEHGDVERTEFIRVRCESTRLYAIVREWWGTPVEARDDEAGDVLAKAQALDARAIELLSSNKWEWVPSLVEWEISAKDMTFRRGFVDAVTIRLDDWLAWGEKFVAATPLRVLQLTSSSNTPTRVFDSQLRKLIMDNEPMDNPVCRLHTLDLSRMVRLERWFFRIALNQAYRPWRGLKKLVLPNWRELRNEEYVKYETNLLKEHIITLETVEFASPRRDAIREWEEANNL